MRHRREPRVLGEAAPRVEGREPQLLSLLFLARSFSNLTLFRHPPELSVRGDPLHIALLPDSASVRTVGFMV